MKKQPNKKEEEKDANRSSFALGYSEYQMQSEVMANPEQVK